MTDSFSLEARYYDKIWGSTDNYEAEAKFLHQIMEKHGALRVLDLACGTGGHCLKLAKLGYEIVGLDITQSMLENAKKKFSDLNIPATFVLGDMTKAHANLKKKNITLLFDAVICMGNSLAHMIDDKMFTKTLSEVQKILKQNGVFIFCVQNVERLRDDKMNKLWVDKILNEPDLHLALLNYNFRDNKNSDILIWNSYWVIRDSGKIDFQVRTHPLRWFQYDALKEMLETHGFLIIQTYGDTRGQEEFDINSHDTIFIICRKE